jgi:hypothetical protein
MGRENKFFQLEGVVAVLGERAIDPGKKTWRLCILQSCASLVSGWHLHPHSTVGTMHWVLYLSPIRSRTPTPLASREEGEPRPLYVRTGAYVRAAIVRSTLLLL